MPLTLSPLVAAFVAANNACDGEALAAQFAADGVVYDEDETFRGPAEIKGWLEHTSRKYRFSLEPLAIDETESDVRMTARISGDFPGSPVELRYRLRLAEGKITSLAITA